MMISGWSFTGGITRPDYQDADRRQYFLDQGGRRGYGVWVLTERAGADQPQAVDATAPEKG